MITLQRLLLGHKILQDIVYIICKLNKFSMTYDSMLRRELLHNTFGQPCRNWCCTAYLECGGVRQGAGGAREGSVRCSGPWLSGRRVREDAGWCESVV